jgi:uncharacterized membrane protein
MARLATTVIKIGAWVIVAFLSLDTDHFLMALMGCVSKVRHDYKSQILKTEFQVHIFSLHRSRLISFLRTFSIAHQKELQKTYQAIC